MPTKAQLYTVALTLVAIIAINKFVPATSNPLR